MLLCAVVALAGAPAVAPAQQTKGTGKEVLDTEDVPGLTVSIVKEWFLTHDTPMPTMRPKLAVLKRSWRPDTDKLIQKFFGSRDEVLKQEPIDNPTWGNGQRYKSGTVIYLLDKDTPVPQDISGLATEVEVVPSFLDVFSTGFTYMNNISHTAVYATDVKVTGKTSADVSYHKVYDVAEGRSAAEQLISQEFGELKAPEGFQPAVSAIIQDFGERLFVYLARLEYVTEYNVYGTEENPDDPDHPRQVVLGTQPVSVPIWDVKVQLMLDGDKLLAGLEYFWDDSVHPVGEPQECIGANEAYDAAREGLWDHFEGQPPLLEVKNISLGYIQDRDDRATLIPVWLFDAWYTQSVSAENENLTDAPPMTSPYARNVVSIPLTFGINALTKELIML